MLLFSFRIELGTREGISAASAAYESLWPIANVCNRCAFAACNFAIDVIIPRRTDGKCLAPLADPTTYAEQPQNKDSEVMNKQRNIRRLEVMLDEIVVVLWRRVPLQFCCCLLPCFCIDWLCAFAPRSSVDKHPENTAGPRPTTIMLVTGAKAKRTGSEGSTRPIFVLGTKPAPQ